jgi:hypothetical protein
LLPSDGDTFGVKLVDAAITYRRTEYREKIWLVLAVAEVAVLL